MLLVEHVEGEGWGKPAIVPFGPLPLHPAAQVLHYGMSCFEGMKAYRGQDGSLRLFRPDMVWGLASRRCCLRRHHNACLCIH